MFLKGRSTVLTQTKTAAMLPEVANGMANSVDPDLTALGLQWLPRPVCLKTWDHYGTTHGRFHAIPHFYGK